jgi:organic hydroperoxide reductase OsmC/OhrA
MSEHGVEIRWQRDPGTFVDQRYSRKHVWLFDGGAEVAASSSPHVVPVPWSDPCAVDPEEAFVVSLSSCHMLWFLSIAAGRGFVVDGYIDRAVGVMGKDDRGRMAMLRVTLRPEARFAEGRGPDDAALHAMHESAHEQCFIANSVRTEVCFEVGVGGA